MNNFKKTLFISIILSLLLGFTAFAKEGMSETKFSESEQVYKYEGADGYYIKNEWKQVWGYWYYFGEECLSKQNTWSEIDGKWYYFDQWSRMLHDTTTPDGYTVGSDGAWIQDVAQVMNN